MADTSRCTRIQPDPTGKKITLTIFVALAAGSVGALLGRAVWDIAYVGPWLAIPIGLVLPLATLYTVWTSHHADCPVCGEEMCLHPKQTMLMCIECKSSLEVHGDAMELCRGGGSHAVVTGATP